MIRPRMTAALWGALDVFPWAKIAREHWRSLKPPDRLAVVEAAKAEIEASRRYVIAERAVLRASAQAGRQLS